MKLLISGIALFFSPLLGSLHAQHPFWPKIWWKGCDVDVRYNSAWDEHGGIHIYENYYAGGWRVYEVRKFAEAGDPCMQGILGMLYEHHTPANIVHPPRTVHQQAVTSSGVELGDITMEVVDIEPPLNYTLAAKWYRRAAEQGHGDAQESLAGLYWSGVGVRQDYAESAKWYLKAANQGLPCSELQLGEMYGDGQGVEKNEVQAHKWLNLAAADEVNLALTKELAKDYCVDTARDERGILAQTMTLVQIAEAQRLARIWKPHISPDPIRQRTYNMDLGKAGRSGR